MRGGPRVRGVGIEGTPPGDPAPSLRVGGRTDLLDRVISAGRSRGGVELELRPFELVTLRFDLG